MVLVNYCRDTLHTNSTQTTNIIIYTDVDSMNPTHIIICEIVFSYCMLLSVGVEPVAFGIE